MPKTETSDELLAKYRDVLGKEFGDIYFHARNEWIDTWVTWNQYEKLFGRGPERVDLLNKSGRIFFYMIQRHIFEATILGVCRLSDPVKTGKKTNLTVLRFREFMNTDARRDALDLLLKKVEKTTKFARDWRNRRISHNDLDLKYGTADPLETATRESVANAIKALHEVLSYISLEFMESELIDEVIIGLDDATTMLGRLYLGVMAHERELEELRNRISLPLERPGWLYD